jgi:predicted nucleic acid-binding protein
VDIFNKNAGTLCISTITLAELNIPLPHITEKYVIGINDLHIAGHARSRGLVLVTNNTGEFRRVEGLRIEDWTMQE